MSDDLPAQLVTAAAEAIGDPFDCDPEEVARAAVVATLRALEDHGYGPDYADPSGVLTRLADRIEQGDGDA